MAATLPLMLRTGMTVFADDPPAHWKKIWPTRPQERLNRETEQRTGVAQAPGPASPGRPAFDGAAEAVHPPGRFACAEDLLHRPAGLPAQ